jgi:hypothetical protein
MTPIEGGARKRCVGLRQAEGLHFRLMYPKIFLDDFNPGREDRGFSLTMAAISALWIVGRVN